MFCKISDFNVFNLNKDKNWPFSYKQLPFWRMKNAGDREEALSIAACWGIGEPSIFGGFPKSTCDLHRVQRSPWKDAKCLWWAGIDPRNNLCVVSWSPRRTFSFLPQASCVLLRAWLPLSAHTLLQLSHLPTPPQPRPSFYPSPSWSLLSFPAGELQLQLAGKGGPGFLSGRATGLAVSLRGRALLLSRWPSVHDWLSFSVLVTSLPSFLWGITSFLLGYTDGNSSAATHPGGPGPSAHRWTAAFQCSSLQKPSGTWLPGKSCLPRHFSCPHLSSVPHSLSSQMLK